MGSPPVGHDVTRLRSAPLRRLLRWVLGASALVVLVLALSQVFLPGIVAGNLRSSLRGSATDVHLSVKATPALELLFGHADGVVLSVGQLRPVGSANIPALLERTREAGSVDATVARLITPKLELDAVLLRKRGERITMSAAVNRSSLSAALPAGLSIIDAGGGSQAIALAAHITLFGQTINATAVLEARNGRIEIVASSPLVPPITLFADPKLAVDALQVAVHGDRYTFSAQGHLT